MGFEKVEKLYLNMYSPPMGKQGIHFQASQSCIVTFFLAEASVFN